MQSKAATPAEYLAALPAERRAVIEAVRAVVRANVDPRIEEAMQYGMLAYVVPHGIYPAGYHCDPKQPLPFVALAAQKNYYSLYGMCWYAGTEHDRWLRSQWAKTGKKLDMGRACIRFKKLEDLPLDLVGRALRRVSLDAYIRQYEAAIGRGGKAKAGRPATKKPARKTSSGM